MLRPFGSIRLILFDAFDTLVQPVTPPFQQYAEEARKAGLGLSDENVAKAFKQAFRSLSTSHPNYGLDTGLTSPDEWWRLVISETFDPSHHPPPHPVTQSQFERLVPGIANRLVRRFGTRYAYRLFPDVAPALTLLSRRGIKMALATNSDSRILQVLSEFNMDRFIDLDYQHAKYHHRGGGGPTLSYFQRCQKPDPRFFHAAVQRNSNGPIEGQGVLYVGDQVFEDFWGAKDAGLEAVWLDRQGERHQPPMPAGDQARGTPEELETLRQRTIHDLVQLVELVT
ncbi:uncharacterized protein PFL1_04430 [Pseudozyma flocculosa PF-1]|uniref:Uncharacterized protein n=2 Tax=Pseudozyma flocculosa TaxID=84751 RepID=A0A5C3FEJ4_9BASI|nr:uncharacterized protein PFL1_04430 [Pseudozyma flocculosa PF-1]EPQ28103.1 hypothetical protein PFL1_04430 [Pseudozyma flocculosa PF-1]SPO41901.1 uncharacterized protein PSFLO_07383 [Pseudozyma flocculosa]